MAKTKTPEAAAGSNMLDLSELDDIDFDRRSDAVTVTVRNSLATRELTYNKGLYPKGKSDKAARLLELEASVNERMRPFPCQGGYYGGKVVAWDAVAQSINQALGNDSNFLSAMTGALFLAEQAKDKKVVGAWLSDDKFVLGIKQILRDFYLLREKLKANKAYDTRGYMTPGDSGEPEPLESSEMRAAFCRRALAVAEILIEVFEFLIGASEPLEFTLTPATAPDESPEIEEVRGDVGARLGK